MPTKPKRTIAGAKKKKVITKASVSKDAKRTRRTKKGGKTSSEGEEDGFLRLPDSTPSGVIYLGHIPHGFYEEQMMGFFSQFGKVEKVRVSRSKKSGRSKGFAFVKFKQAAVASTVANVMNGYHLFDKVLVSHVVPSSKVHPSMFKGANRKFKPVPWKLIAKKQHNRERTEEERTRAVTRLGRRQQKLRKKLKALGIEYDFKGYASAPTSSSTAPKTPEKSTTAVENKKSTKKSTKKKKSTRKKR